MGCSTTFPRGTVSVRRTSPGRAPPAGAFHFQGVTIPNFSAGAETRLAPRMTAGRSGGRVTRQKSAVLGRRSQGRATRLRVSGATAQRCARTAHRGASSRTRIARAQPRASTPRICRDHGTSALGTPTSGGRQHVDERRFIRLPLRSIAGFKYNSGNFAEASRRKHGNVPIAIDGPPVVFEYAVVVVTLHRAPTICPVSAQHRRSAAKTESRTMARRR